MSDPPSRPPEGPVAVADRDALDAFVEIARLGSAVRAALALGRTQPSISARVATLEARWGVRLFRRTARGMETTPEGERLLPAARAALDALAAVDREAGVVPGDAELRLGCGDALGRRVLPRALADLRREFPALAVRIVEGPTSALLAAVRRGEIDLAFVAADGHVDPVAPRRAEGDLEWEPLVRSGVDVLLPPGFAARGTRSIRIAALAATPLVLLQVGSSFRTHVEDAFRRAGRTPWIAVEVGSLSLVRRFVATGLGAGPIPAIAFGEESMPGGRGRKGTRLRLQAVPDVLYGVVRRAGVRPGPAASFLIRAVRD